MGGGDLLLPESEGTPLEGKFPGLLELGWERRSSGQFSHVGRGGGEAVSPLGLFFL